MTGHLFYDRIDKLLPLLPLHADLLHQFIVRIRLQIFQRKVIEFDLDLGNTEALCDRGINIHRLTRFFLLRLRRPVLCGPHVVQTVRQFYQNNADILCHRKEHLSQVFCLLLDLIRRIFQLCQLRDTAYNQDTSGPNSSVSSSSVMTVSSTTSCRRPAAIDSLSSSRSARIIATQSDG